MTLICASAFRAVELLRIGPEILWLMNSSQPAQELTMSMSIQPGRVAGDGVTIGWGSRGRSVIVEDEEMRSDPRRGVIVGATEHAATGEVVPLAHVADHAVGVGVLMLDVLDCQDRGTDKWRVRPDLVDALPPFLAVIAGGRQRGRVFADPGDVLLPAAAG